MIHTGNIMRGENNILVAAAEGVTTEQIQKSSQIKVLLESVGGANMIYILLFLIFSFRQRYNRLCQTKAFTTTGKSLFPVSLKTKQTCVSQCLPAAH